MYIWLLTVLFACLKSVMKLQQWVVCILELDRAITLTCLFVIYLLDKQFNLIFIHSCSQNLVHQNGKPLLFLTGARCKQGSVDNHNQGGLLLSILFIIYKYGSQFEVALFPAAFLWLFFLCTEQNTKSRNLFPCFPTIFIATTLPILSFCFHSMYDQMRPGGLAVRILMAGRNVVVLHGGNCRKEVCSLLKSCYKPAAKHETGSSVASQKNLPSDRCLFCSG